MVKNQLFLNIFLLLSLSNPDTSSLPFYPQNVPASIGREPVLGNPNCNIRRKNIL